MGEGRGRDGWGGWSDGDSGEGGLRARRAVGDEDSRNSDDDANADGEWTYNGIGGPCVQCGRRFQHKHFRALRQGGGARRGGEDDEERDDGDDESTSFFFKNYLDARVFRFTDD